MRAQRIGLVGEPGGDAGAEHRLGDRDDPPLAIEREARHCPELAAVVTLAQQRDLPVPADAAGRGLDRDPLDGHRADVEIFEFEPRHGRLVPPGEQPLAAVEPHPRRQRDAQGPPLARRDPHDLGGLRPDPRLDPPDRGHW